MKNDNRFPPEMLNRALKMFDLLGDLPDGFVSDFADWASNWPKSYKSPIHEKAKSDGVNSPWLTLEQAAEYLGVCKKTISRLREREVLTTYYPPKVDSPRVRRDELDRIMKAEEG